MDRQTVGGALINVDVRVVCATHRPIEKMLGERTFRDDLYFRLAEITLSVPPLREREGDAVLLAHAFLRRFAPDRKLRLADDGVKALTTWNWPGNVRELENRVKRASIMSDGTQISATDQPPANLVGPMKIGIRWHGNWDLDLYASAKPGAPTLFFQNTRCPEGYYYKDHRSSPEREYEFIEFTLPVNVNEVEAMVNFYRGNAHGGAMGEVRIEFEGRIYSGTFRIPASEGNEGRLDASQADYWTRIDVPKLLRLESRS